MEDLILLFGIENASLRGFTFGFIHVFLILIGYYSGWSINRFIKIASNGYVAGIIGAALAHVIADLIAAIIDPTASKVASLLPGEMIVSPSSEEKPFFGKELFTNFK